MSSLSIPKIPQNADVPILFKTRQESQKLRKFALLVRSAYLGKSDYRKIGSSIGNTVRDVKGGM